MTAAEVGGHSPILAARSAVVVRSCDEDDLRDAADKVADAAIALTFERSPGHWLRAQVAQGLSWLHAPGFLPESLRYIDDHYDEGYSLASPRSLATPMIRSLTLPASRDPS